MLHVSVTGIRVRGLSALMPASLVAHRFLSSARKAPGCLRAGAFRKNDTIYAFTVWEGRHHLRFFETSPCFAALVAGLERGASLVETQRFLCERMPSRQQLRSLWSSARVMLAA